MHGVQVVAMDMLVTHVHYPKNWRKKEERGGGEWREKAIIFLMHDDTLSLFTMSYDSLFLH